jgi:hypothetical protein
MSGRGANIEILLERVIQMNMIIIEEMQKQQQSILTRLDTQSFTTNDVSANSSSPLLYEISVKLKEFNGTSDENIITWLTVLEEIMGNRLVTDDERISVAVSLLGGTALQWFVNLKLKYQRPASWSEFREKIISQFQTVDFQEHLRQQLFQLRQKHSVFSEYFKSDQ